MAVVLGTVCGGNLHPRHAYEGDRVPCVDGREWRRSAVGLGLSWEPIMGGFPDSVESGVRNGLRPGSVSWSPMARRRKAPTPSTCHKGTAAAEANGRNAAG